MPPDVTSGRIGQRMCNGRLINLICELGLSACKFWRETMCSELCSPALHLDLACKVLNARGGLARGPRAVGRWQLSMIGACENHERRKQ